MCPVARGVVGDGYQRRGGSAQRVGRDLLHYHRGLVVGDGRYPDSNIGAVHGVPPHESYG